MGTEADFDKAGTTCAEIADLMGSREPVTMLNIDIAGHNARNRVNSGPPPSQEDTQAAKANAPDQAGALQ